MDTSMQMFYKTVYVWTWDSPQIAYLCIITKAPDTISSVIKGEKFPLIVTT